MTAPAVDPAGTLVAPAAVATRPRAVLAVLSTAQFLIALDYSIIYVALPSIAHGLRLSPTPAQWVVSAYAVLFAGFLVVGGRLSDRFGAGRLFVLAIVGFGVASAVGGLAGDGAVLLAARGVQGLCAAPLQPAVLGLIGVTFPAGPARSRAVAVWGTVGAGGLVAGVILGGLLTALSWRLTFEINVPLTLLCALGAVRWAGGRRASDRTRRTGAGVPLLSAALATGAALALVLGLTFGPALGWGHPAAVGCLALAVLLAAGFVRHERGGATGRAVLIGPVLRRSRSLRAGAAATALYMASVGSEFYLLTLLMQRTMGYPPLLAGLAFLPMAALVVAGNVAAERLVRRVDPAVVLAGGFAVAAVGLAWLAVALPGGSYPADLLPGLLVSGFGHGAIFTAMFIIGGRDVPAEHQATAGALLTTSQYLSGAVTLAVLTLVLGAAPGPPAFTAAFGLTAAAALAGLVSVLVPALAGRRAG